MRIVGLKDVSEVLRAQRQFRAEPLWPVPAALSAGAGEPDVLAA